MLAADTLKARTGDAVEWISVAQIGTDRRVNTRPVDTAWVDAKVREGFDPAKLGVLTVSRRKDGTIVCLDGQNRCELLKRAGWPTQQIQCRVLTGLTVTEEARLFLGLNDNRRVMPVYKFLAQVTAGEEHAVAINAIVTEAGWRISDSYTNRGITAVGALSTVYRATPKRLGLALRSTMSAVTTAWGHKPEAVNGSLLHGIGLVYVRYGDQVDTPALVKKLSEFPGGPSGIIGKARGRRQVLGGTIANCVGQTVAATYNERRRSGALPDWQ